MDKVLTVVIPTYNMEQYLRRCLDSLIIDGRELFAMLEVLVVNDGSKDRSSAIAHEYETKYPSVFRVIDKENGNYGSCVNVGNKEARGTYFRTLDADDWFDKDSLALFLKSLSSEQEVDVVLTNFRETGPDGRMLRFCKASVPGGIHSFDDFEFVGTSVERLLTMHAITYSTRLIRKVGLHQQEGISYTDMEYCYFPLVEARTFRYVDVVLYQYLVGREGQTVSVESSIRHFNDYDMVARRLIDDYIPRRKDLTACRRRSLSRLIFNPVVNVFIIPLVYSKEVVPYEYGRMLEMDRKIEETPVIRRMVCKYTYSKIPFYVIWKYLHFRVGRIIGKQVSSK